MLVMASFSEVIDIMRFSEPFCYKVTEQVFKYNIPIARFTR